MQLTEQLIHDIEQQALGLSYPRYVQKLKEIGITNYEVRVKNHNRKFTSYKGQELLLTGDLPEVICADEYNRAAVKAAVRRTQEGLTDYPEFLKELAAAGIHNYLADLDSMKILYMGKNAGDLYTEAIPEPE
ncbi:DUF1398 domain-containing protein [Flavihumibacter sp. R14]|nr:DUF1398 domain-containing protein [Flavihumibacter soli]